jgi:precorrin-6A/cobalt-precorrin-6A reductase
VLVLKRPVLPGVEREFGAVDEILAALTQNL